jgi:hypothetical protein
MEFMSGKVIKYATLAFALAWFSANVHAAYYVVLRLTDLHGNLAQRAHDIYSNGVFVSRPHRYSANMASDVFGWLLHDRGSQLLPAFGSITEAERHMRSMGVEDGFLLEISPDERAFNLRQTISNLMAAVPNHGDERAQIVRWLSNLFSDYTDSDLLAGLPLPTDQAPVARVIRGENIGQIYIYSEGIQRAPVERGPEDGPFVPGSAEHADEGYPFDPPTASSPPFPFPEGGPRVSVVMSTNHRPTDNVTSLASCSALADRQASARSNSQDSCDWEWITMGEFNALHARHRGVLPALLLLN